MTRTQAGISSQHIAHDAGLDARIIDRLQAGLRVVERPFLEAAEALEIEEAVLIDRLRALLDDGVLSRFGPMFNADAMGGAYSLCAMAVPEARFDAVCAEVNEHPEIAHNYARTHALNMWFVIAAERPARIAEVIRDIESSTGLAVLDFPKEEEYFIGLHLDPRAGATSND